MKSITHASIWIQKEPNKYVGVYLHLFPEMYNAGYILLTEYKTKEKVDSLISHGDILELREFVNEKGSLEKYNTIFYSKNKNEKVNQFITNSENGTNKYEYSYLFKKNKWHICLVENYQELSIDLIEDEIENPLVFKKY